MRCARSLAHTSIYAWRMHDHNTWAVTLWHSDMRCAIKYLEDVSEVRSFSRCLFIFVSFVMPITGVNFTVVFMPTVPRILLGIYRSFNDQFECCTNRRNVKWTEWDNRCVLLTRRHSFRYPIDSMRWSRDTRRRATWHIVEIIPTLGWYAGTLSQVVRVFLYVIKEKHHMEHAYYSSYSPLYKRDGTDKKIEQLFLGMILSREYSTPTMAMVLSILRLRRTQFKSAFEWSTL